MNTRVLESNEIIKNTISSLEVLKAEGNTLLFKTSSIPQRRKSALISDEADIMGIVSDAKNAREGRLCIDVLSDTMLRIRYAEGDAVPENATPMVIGSFTGPSKTHTVTQDKLITLTTDAIKVTVNPQRYYIDVRTLDGRKICRIGGPEKNNFRQWDAYNTGVCRTLDDEKPLAVECFGLDPHEAIYGFGEKFIRLNKIGQTIDLDMQESLGTTTDRKSVV